MLREHTSRGTFQLEDFASGGMRLEPGAHASLINWVEQMIRLALTPYVRHPPAVTHFFGEFIFVTFATHPDAVRMLDRALDPRALPRPAAGTLGHAGGHPQPPGHEAAAASLHVASSLAIALARCHRGESEAALLARGQAAIGDALATFDPEDEIPVENHVWACLIPVLYEGLADLQPPPVRGMPRVFRRVAQHEAMLEYEPDPRPPLVRLLYITRRLSTELVTAYAAGLRRQLPD